MQAKGRSSLTNTQLSILQRIVQTQRVQLLHKEAELAPATQLISPSPTPVAIVAQNDTLCALVGVGGEEYESLTVEELLSFPISYGQTTPSPAQSTSSSSSNNIVNSSKRASKILTKRKEREETFCSSDGEDFAEERAARKSQIHAAEPLCSISTKEDVFFLSTNLQTPNIGDEDFVRVVRLAADNPKIWNRLVDKPDLKSYATIETFRIDNKSGLRFYKFEGTLPLPKEKLLQFLVSKRYKKQFDSMLVEDRLVEYITPSSPASPTSASSSSQQQHGKQYPNAVIYQTYRLAFPFNLRDYCISNSVKYEPENNRFLWAQKSTQHHKYPVRKNHVRAMGMGGFIVEELTPTTSKYVIVAYMDLGGFISPKLFDSLAKLRSDGHHYIMKKILSNQQVAGEFTFDPHEDDHMGVLDTLVENCKEIGFDCKIQPTGLTLSPTQNHSLQ